ncbi:MAG: DUF5665 domain-containing protein [Pelagimonas sp.]|jgi:hypothetical protein|nr:DUF5665 domain-containing protein [Pelagimonas sp.]
MTQPDPDLQAQLDQLTQEVARLNENRFVRAQNSFLGLAGMFFLRGLFLGLGTAIGATALVSVLVLLLAQVEFVPILGDLAVRIIEEIEPAR